MGMGIATRSHWGRSYPVMILFHNFSSLWKLVFTHAGVDTDFASRDVQAGQPDGVCLCHEG
jgi:hypothetical protein